MDAHGMGTCGPFDMRDVQLVCTKPGVPHETPQGAVHGLTELADNLYWLLRLWACSTGAYTGDLLSGGLHS